MDTQLTNVYPVLEAEAKVPPGYEKKVIFVRVETPEKRQERTEKAKKKREEQQKHYEEEQARQIEKSKKKCLYKNSRCGRAITCVKPYKCYILFLLIGTWFSFIISAASTNPKTIHTGIFSCPEIDCRNETSSICSIAKCKRCLFLDDCDGDCVELKCEDVKDSYEEPRSALNTALYVLSGVVAGFGLIIIWPCVNSILDKYDVYHWELRIYDDCTSQQNQRLLDSSEDNSKTKETKVEEIKIEYQKI